MTEDEKIAEVIRLCKKARVTVHVRGTDARPVVEVKDRFYRSVIGGTELKRRLAV